MSQTERPEMRANPFFDPNLSLEDQMDLDGLTSQDRGGAEPHQLSATGEAWWPADIDLNPDSWQNKGQWERQRVRRIEEEEQYYRALGFPINHD